MSSMLIHPKAYFARPSRKGEYSAMLKRGDDVYIHNGTVKKKFTVSLAQHYMCSSILDSQI